MDVKGVVAHLKKALNEKNNNYCNLNSDQFWIWTE